MGIGKLTASHTPAAPTLTRAGRSLCRSRQGPPRPYAVLQEALQAAGMAPVWGQRAARGRAHQLRLAVDRLAVVPGQRHGPRRRLHRLAVAVHLRAAPRRARQRLSAAGRARAGAPPPRPGPAPRRSRRRTGAGAHARRDRKAARTVE